MRTDHTNYQLLPDDEMFEEDETIDSAELTRKVVAGLQEATRQARQEKHPTERLVYDAQDDSLLIRLAEGTIVRTQEVQPGVLFNYDASGQILSVDMLNASARIPRREEATAA